MIQWKTLRGRRTNPIGVIVPRRHGRKVLPRRRRSMSLLALSSLWWCLLLLVVYNCVGTVESATNPNNNKDKEHDYEGNDGVAFMIDDDDLEDSHFDFDNYEKKQCRDLRPACAEWAAPPGACHDGDNVLYMHAHCPVACGVCHERVTRFSTAATRRRSTRTTQPTKTNRGAATPDSSAPPLHQQQQQQPFGVYDQMLSERSVILYDAIRLSEPIRTTSSTAAWSRSVPQRLVGNDEIIDTAIRELLRDTADYLHTEVATDERYRLVRDSCRLHHSECALRAVTTNDCGNDDDDDVDDHVAAAEEVEQKKRRDFMIQNCAPVCFACEYQHIEAQCPIDPLAKHGECVCVCVYENVGKEDCSYCSGSNIRRVL